jgi:hypothetical protein
MNKKQIKEALRYRATINKLNRKSEYEKFVDRLIAKKVQDEIYNIYNLSNFNNWISNRKG